MPPRVLYLYRWFMWNVFTRPLIRCYLLPKYRHALTPDSAPFPKPPFILIANHGTFFDPWLIGTYCRIPTALMCNDDAFRGPPITRWYLNSIGAFPKKKGQSDFKAMKKTMSLLSKGYPVCIFPEGQTTWDGETQLMYKGIERIVKHAHCPLVSVHLRGNFLTKPWWARTIRKGRIRITVSVLGADRVAGMTHDELFSYMRTSIQQNDVTDPSNLAIPFTGHDLAEGIGRLLWICPHCRTEDHLATVSNTIRCASCGKSWTLDAWCRTTPDQPGTTSHANIHAWAQWQRGQVLERVRTVAVGTVLAEDKDVVLRTKDDSGSFADTASGDVRLTSTELTFTPTGPGHPPLSIPLADITTYVIQRKDIFECTRAGVDYRFVLDKKSPMKWICYVRYLKGYERLEQQGWIE